MKVVRAQQSTDGEIRAALHRKVLRRNHVCPNTVVINELGVGHGRGRVDVAVVNGCIHGYEIKSSKDTLERLPMQLAEFSRCLEKLTFIVAPNHLAEVSRLIPEWSGLIVAEVGPRRGINFTTFRSASTNPNVELVELSRLLWKSEVLEYLCLMGVEDVGARVGKEELYKRLVSKVTLRELTLFIKNSFMSRETWRVELQPLLYDGSRLLASK